MGMIGRAVVLAMVLVGGGGMVGAELGAASGAGRFFHDGDGRIHLVSKKNGKSFSGRYRSGGGAYDPSALAAVCAVFDAPYDPLRPRLSLRLLAYLDHLEDRLRPGARITITSGYRNPTYNRKVRKSGALAAKASLHQYGMAADFYMQGVSSERIWETVKDLGFGGAGYYHGKTVHVDVGPARSWDEKTSGVGTGISDNNKLIDLVTDYDIYRPGETLVLQFTRMTAFPIGVAPGFRLVPVGRRSPGAKPLTFKPAFAVAAIGGCPRFADIDQMARVRWRLPATLPAGRYAIRARFCGNPWEDMPGEVQSLPFEVTSP